MAIDDPPGKTSPDSFSKGDESRTNPQRAWSSILRLVFIAAIAVSVAYQIRPPFEIDMGAGFLSAPFVEGFHDAEGRYRWSRARSCLVIPDPGAGIEGQLDLEISGFRPRGQASPIVVIEAPGTTQRLQSQRRFHTFSFPVSTRGLWSSDLRVCLRSETYTPGPGDRRSLGVRVHRARWQPGTPLLELGLPSFRQITWASFGVALFFATLIRLGLDVRRSFIAGLGVIAGLALGYTLARPYTAFVSFPFLIAVALAWGTSRFLPLFVAGLGRYVCATARSAKRGLKLLPRRASLALILIGALVFSSAYFTRASITIDLGSGRETTLTRGFDSYDAESGIRFRRARRGAALDLRDFGGGGRWRITVIASLSNGETRALPLAQAGSSEVEALLGEAWSQTSFVADAPFGWTSGLRIEFPGASENRRLRIDRVEVDRGRSLPSLRVVVALIGAALIFLVACGACGLESRWCYLSASLFLAAEAVCLFADPVLAIPFSGTFFGISMLGALVASLAGGMIRHLEQKGMVFHNGASVATLTTLGFIVWLAAMSFPLYRGLHFIYHSNIAEEIWKGKFLVFYLPHPDNILSREAQWGGLVVPYPCTYHTLIAPLNALPSSVFFFIQKLIQASMLSMMAFGAGLLAHRYGNAKAGVWAALVMISLKPTFQLLALSHFLTVFGCWAASGALAYLVFTLKRLEERAYWWGAVGLLSFAFLSYTASLLFTACALAMALPFLFRRNTRLARSVLTSAATALVVAFFLYYVHWVLPFVRESVPILLSSSEEGPIPLWARLSALPRRLAYSYGSPLVPICGLTGLAILGLRSRDLARYLLIAWAGILVVFGGLDVFFNFILKHHYFVMVPVAVGCGLLVDMGMKRRFLMRALAAAFLCFVAALGGRSAIALAMGVLD